MKIASYLSLYKDKKVGMVNSNKISEIKIVIEGLLKDLDSLSETEMISHLKWEDLFTNIDIVKQKLNSMRIEQERSFVKEKEQEIKALSRAIAELKGVIADPGVNILDVEREDISVAAIENIPDNEEEFEIELLEEDVDISEPEWMLDEPGPSVDNLSEAITLNDKICFINDLFKGDSEQYYLSVQRLNEFAHFKEALEYTRRAFPHWDEESPEVYRFYMILRRRYDE